MSDVSQVIESLPPKKRAVFEALLKRKKEQRSLERAPIPRRKEPDSIPLSFTQQRVWFLEQLVPGRPTYRPPVAIRLTGSLNVAALEQSFNQIVRRHEILRTTFATVDGQPVQIIAPVLTAKLPVVDLQEFPETDREAHAQRLITEEASCPFDLVQGPLFRASLLRLGKEAHILLLNFHPTVSDGWSVGLFTQELVTLYEAFLGGKPSPLPELPIQYADFAQWQRQFIQAGELKEALVYWKQQLAGPLPILELVTDHSHPTGIVPKVVRQTCALGTSMTEELKALSRRERVTLFVIILAAFKALLYRFTGQTDIIVGSPIADRDRTKVQGLIGPFLNTLVLRTDLSGDPTFLELLGRVHQVVRDAFAYKELPFERLVQELQPERDLNRNPLFQVVFVERAGPMVSLELPSLRVSLLPDEFKLGEAPDMLGICIEDTKEGIIGLECRTDILNQNILGHFRTLLESIVANPQQRLSALPLLTEAEQHQLLIEWNDPEITYPSEPCLHWLFEAQVTRMPDALALVFEDMQLSYRELNARANQLAHHLQALGVGPEVPVGLYVERSVEMVVGVLGILKAGGAYLPMDPVYPPERLVYMLEDAQTPVLLTQESLAANLQIGSCKSQIEDLATVCLDTDWKRIAQESAENPESGVVPGNTVYVIYTSGSTGKPKGTLVSHANVVRLMTATEEWYHFDAQDVWTWFHSFAFDFSVWEMWGALLYGGRLVVVSYWVSRSPEVFYDLLADERVTVLNQTPSAFRQLMRAEEQAAQHDLALRLVIFGGEALELQSLRPWFERHGDRQPQLVNMYGITETTVHVTYRPLTLDDLDCAPGSMIGRPIPDLQVYVLDAHLQPVPVGVPGELHIGGAGLARGYHNRPDLTAEKFIPNPFRAKAGTRLYKTGDLACYMPGGDVGFLGRIDYQVKVRGFRIELGEIEAVLGQSPAVREVVVTARKDVPDEKRLVAYVVPRQEQAPTPGDLRELARRQLPDYMIPSAFVLLDALPLTPNGKVDRRALPAPDVAQLERLEEFVAPETPLEKRLAEIWAKVLGVEWVGIYDNFFDLGGHSLMATQLLYQTNKAFGVDLPVSRLFREEPTVASLALLIEETLIEKLEERVRGRASEQESTDGPDA